VQPFDRLRLAQRPIVDGHDPVRHRHHHLLCLDLLAPGGKLVLESHVTLDDDMKAYFVEGKFGGDVTWYWLPSVPALRAYGFTDIKVRAHYPVPTRIPEDPTHTVEGHPAGGRVFLTAMRPTERVHRPKFGWSK
jgi:hypothetical protein